MRLLTRFTMVILSLVGALSLSAQNLTPWQRLEKGNTAFQGNSITFDNLIQERKDHVKGQWPDTIVLSCSDSRVPPELVFKQSIGEIFLVRSAGNVTDTDGIASMEYALTRPPEEKWDPKLLVVLAHEDCGAVKTAIATGESPSPNVTHLLRQIRASFKGACRPGTDCLMTRTRENAEYAVKDLKRHSEIIRKAIDSGKLRVVVGYYQLASGKVVVW